MTPRGRHLAAVMFTDVVGYTAMMQREETEALAARSRHRSALHAAVAGHGGEVVQFLGDGSVTVFSSAVEAVHAAIEIQASAGVPPRLPLRIGIHQGDITYDEQGIVGDSVNIAARVQELSQPGGIVITAKVHDEIRNHPKLTALTLGDVRLKGVARPMALFAVTVPGVVTGGTMGEDDSEASPNRESSRSVIHERILRQRPFTAVQGSDTTHTTHTTQTIPALPFVGRDADWAVVRSCLDETEAGRGRTLLLAGESGIGKTRLAEAAHEEAQRREWGFAIGRANQVEADLPYALFADALLPTIQTLSEDARTVMSRGVLDELAVLFPALERLRPRGESPARERQSADFRNRLFWNFASFLEDLSRSRPLLVILEDLHWADPSSLELFHFLARQTTGARIAFVCTYRDDMGPLAVSLRSIERSLASLDVATRHAVRPLTYQATDELVRRAFQIPEPVSRTFTALLYGWTRGNPFFIEEVLKTLVESGSLRREGGTWLGWDLEELQLPESVRETVTLRAGRLDDQTTRVAELAAVLGGRIRLDQLEAVTDLSVAALLPIIDELEKHRILVDSGARDVVSYEFGHPIVRETVYANLGRARAGVLHGVVATALERFYDASAPAHAGELAYHYAHAIDRTLADKAVRYLEAAGRTALATYANPEALKYLRAALDRIESGAAARTPVEIARITSSLAHAHQRTGNTLAAIALWKQAKEVADTAGDSKMVARIERRVGLAHYWAGEAAEALVHFEAGATAARDAGDSARLAMLQVANGLCLQELGRAEDALKELGSALELAEELGETSLLARVHRALLLIYLWTGPPKLAKTHGERALELAAETNDVMLSFWVHWAMATLAGLTGDAKRMASHLGECESVAAQLRSPLLRMWVSELAVEFAFGDGRWDEGLAIGENAISMARALHQPTLMPRLLVWTSLIYLGRNDLDRGKAYVDEAWALACGTGNGHGEAVRHSTGTSAEGALPGALAAASVHAVIPAHIGRAAYHLANENYEEAIRTAEAALALVDRTGYDVWAVHRLLPIAAEASLYLRDVERAHRFGVRLRTGAEHFENRLGLAWADACDALMIWLKGDGVRGADLMRAAVVELEAIPFIPDAARLRRQMAGRLADMGDRDGALRELRLAYRTFLKLGAEKEVERTRQQFRELDARPPSPDQSPGALGLTPKELAIARAAAGGMSNKALAKKFNNQLRTVTTHISNIYRKLGVTNRQELTEAIRAAERIGEIKRR